MTPRQRTHSSNSQMAPGFRSSSVEGNNEHYSSQHHHGVSHQVTAETLSVGEARSLSAPPHPSNEKGRDERTKTMKSQHPLHTMPLTRPDTSVLDALLVEQHADRNVNSWQNHQSPAVSSSDKGSILFHSRENAEDFTMRDTANATPTTRNIRSSDDDTVPTTGYGSEALTRAALQQRGVAFPHTAAANSSSTPKVIRPRPIKTTAPTASPVLVAPQARTVASSIEEESSLLDNRQALASLRSTEILEEGENNSESKESPERSNNNIATAKPAAAASTQDTDPRDEKRRKKEKNIERQRKRQQAQCAFKTAATRSMPPSSSERSVVEGVAEYREENAPPQVESSAASNNNGSSPHRSPGGRIASSRPPIDPDAARQTPMFERLVTEEVRECHSLAKIVEKKERRIQELQDAHDELNNKLMIETSSRQELEETLENREREWLFKLEQLQTDRDSWKKQVDDEKAIGEFYKKKCERHEQEIRRMLQRKYDHEGSKPSVRGMRGSMPSERAVKAASSRSPDLHRSPFASPDDALHQGTAAKARLKNARSLLLDFFGM